MSDLLARAAELVDVPSLSGHEGALADLVQARLDGVPGLEVERVGDNVVARTALGRSERLVVAGHLDTVPPAGNDRARVVDDVLWGLGAADMKGALAVMLEVAGSTPEPAVDLTWCFYACEEVSRDRNGLLALWEARPDLLEADAAVLMEPTDGLVEAGCQGTLRAVVTIGGVRAHTARPYAGVNAIHRMAPVLDLVAEWQPRTIELEGCEYVEQLQAVGVDGGVAGNVVPDQVTLTLNYRYAPDRSGEEARRFLPALFDQVLDPDQGDALEVVDQADGAPPALEHPLLARLVAATGSPPRAKNAWTDVASFWAHGVPATNFGPGDPLLAHHAEERVGARSLEHARRTLTELVTPTA